MYFGSLGISLYLELFCFLSFISFVLRKLTLSVLRYLQKDPNVSGRVTLLPGTKFRSVSFNKRQQNEEAFFPETFMARACFHNVSQFPIRATIFLVSVFVFKMQNMLTPHGREL